MWWIGAIFSILFPPTRNLAMQLVFLFADYTNKEHVRPHVCTTLLWHMSLYFEGLSKSTANKKLAPFFLSSPHLVREKALFASTS